MNFSNRQVHQPKGSDFIDVVYTFNVPRVHKNIMMSSFKSSRDIQKKEGGPDSCFG